MVVQKSGLWGQDRKAASPCGFGDSRSKVDMMKALWSWVPRLLHILVPRKKSVWTTGYGHPVTDLVL